MLQYHGHSIHKTTRLNTMKKLLCLFLNTTIFCSIYAGTDFVPPVQSPSLSPVQSPTFSYSFDRATLSLQHQLLDGTLTTRILTPADPPIFLKPNGSAEFFKSNHDAVLNKGLLIGFAGGLTLTLGLFWIAHRFLRSNTKNNNDSQQ